MQEHIQLDDLQVGAVVSLFSAICGALSYGLKVEEGKPFRWMEFIIHVSVSAICGLCTFELAAEYGLPSATAGALCGMSGWMGTRLVRLAEVALTDRLGLRKENPND